VGDSRTAVSTSALSRRWRRLNPARWLPAFDFSVGDHLSPQYAATLHRYRDAQQGRDDEARRALARQVFTCEDRAMEAYVRELARFLRSPERYPAARSLRLEFYVTPPEEHKDAASTPAVGSAMAACVASALRWPQIERLAIYAFPRGVAAAFGAHEISDPEFIEALRLTDSRLVTLHVKNCLTKSGGGYGLLFPALSRLTIETTPGVKAVFPRSYFNDLLQSCRNLVFLRLVSCNFADGVGALPFKLDLSPASKLGELVLSACNFEDVRLVNTPSLERLVIHKCDRLCLTVDIAPRLATLVCRGTAPWIYGSGTARTLQFVELSPLNYRQCQERLESFFQCTPKVEVLELCFRDGWVNRVSHKKSQQCNFFYTPLGIHCRNLYVLSFALYN